MARKVSEKVLDVGTGSDLYILFVSDQPVKKTFLSSGELAKAAGVSRDTLRHYEKMGVLARPRRTTSGYREYPASAVERVLLIRQALKVGFTLDELSRILKVRDRGGVPCRQVRQLAESKLATIEERLQELLAMREALRQILGDWDARLGAANGKPATLLESLTRIQLPVEENVASHWHGKKKGRNKTDE